jgi:hypothetical protein
VSEPEIKGVLKKSADDQCCQLAEILAAKHTKKWHFKNISGRKKRRPNFLLIFQKMAEKWPNFPATFYSHKSLHY